MSDPHASSLHAWPDGPLADGPLADGPLADGSLAARMGITERAVARRIEIVGFGADDAKRVTALAAVFAEFREEFVGAFFGHLATLAEASVLMQSGPILAAARQLKLEHLSAMVAGDYRLAYAEERLKLGLIYAQVGLDPCVFIGAFHHMLSAIGCRLMVSDPDTGFLGFMSFRKLAAFDLSLIVDVIVYERGRVIRAQQETIRELSTPILRLRDHMLVLPIVGNVDMERERMLTENLLQAIRMHRATVVLLDVTGVPAIDSNVANHLARTVETARLMGTRTILTGISAATSESLVTLRTGFASVETVADLQTGLELAAQLQRGGRLSPGGPAMKRR